MTSNYHPITKLQATRRSWDYIIAAYYYYTGPDTGYRSVARLFQMPMTTIRHIIERTPRSDPEVRLAAMRFGLIKVRIDDLPRGAVASKRDGIDKLITGVL